MFACLLAFCVAVWVCFVFLVCLFLRWDVPLLGVVFVCVVGYLFAGLSACLFA